MEEDEEEESVCFGGSGFSDDVVLAVLGGFLAGLPFPPGGGVLVRAGCGGFFAFFDSATDVVAAGFFLLFARLSLNSPSCSASPAASLPRAVTAYCVT
jgi:hypothetical protein